VNYPHHHHPPKHKRHFLFRSFIALFGILSLLYFIGLSITTYLLSENTSISLQFPPRIRFFIALFLIPVVIFLLAGVIGRLSFRRLGAPIINIMTAIDEVSKGNLDTQVGEIGPRYFRNLAHSFNRMTGELARAEQQRRNMTADIAHELRTPLHIIQGNLEGMLDGVYEPTPENLNAMLDETHLLTRLVSDLQTLSLAEAGQLPLHPTRFPVADLLNDVVASFSSHAAGQSVTLQANVETTVELNADYDRLDQVLSNLVANALRYTPEGGSITLTTRADAAQVIITVTDNGAGIAPEDLPYIFDRFWKGDRARTRDGAGSGLGLAIARQLVRAHGGSIEAASQVGQGATFTITLPITSEE
jgi:two-component system OmpR family sensor kinase/two-component system sensor histidine kinase BaeS